MSEFRWETHPEANIKLEVPVDWSQTRADGGRVVLTSPLGDIEVELDFVTTGAKEAAADERALIAHLRERMTEARVVAPPAAKSQHGLSGFGVAGTGVRDGKEIEWFTFAVGDRVGHGLVALAIAPKGQMGKQNATLGRIVGSIQPAQPAQAT